MENQNPPLPNDMPHFYESLEQLRKAYSDSYYNRQTYEWKMCITIWTPLVAFIGISLTYPQVWIPRLTLGAACSFLFLIHSLWQWHLMASNNKDADKILECEQIIRKYLGLSLSTAPKLWLIKGWSHYLYLVITICLISLAFYVNDLKRDQVVMLPNELNEWLEKNPEIGFKKKGEYVAEVLRKHIGSKDTEHQETNVKRSPLTEEKQGKTLENKLIKHRSNNPHNESLKRDAAKSRRAP